MSRTIAKSIVWLERDPCFVFLFSSKFMSSAILPRFCNRYHLILNQLNVILEHVDSFTFVSKPSLWGDDITDDIVMSTIKRLCFVREINLVRCSITDALADFLVTVSCDKIVIRGCPNFSPSAHIKLLREHPIATVRQSVSKSLIDAMKEENRSFVHPIRDGLLAAGVLPVILHHFNTGKFHQRLWHELVSMLTNLAEGMTNDQFRLVAPTLMWLLDSDVAQIRSLICIVISNFMRGVRGEMLVCARVTIVTDEHQLHLVLAEMIKNKDVESAEACAATLWWIVVICAERTPKLDLCNPLFAKGFWAWVVALARDPRLTGDARYSVLRLLSWAPCCFDQRHFLEAGVIEFYTDALRAVEEEDEDGAQDSAMNTLLDVLGLARNGFPDDILHDARNNPDKLRELYAPLKHLAEIKRNEWFSLLICFFEEAARRRSDETSRTIYRVFETLDFAIKLERRISKRVAKAQRSHANNDDDDDDDQEAPQSPQSLPQMMMFTTFCKSMSFLRALVPLYRSLGNSNQFQ